ncbi:putative manganese-transporting ATPase [Phytophthora fragariae]|uniref:Putative manganese-transporting ATPase n=1 Tax=Phytophthora fragariae TaxID=53985 RepID=A0A6A3YSG7_9STRA|nr:putative manganese-transporting ATPase [Phytophthora fragariae]KAE9006000.1 putative manganese-transporting ATPase [Phytophthora fragariae]KAE9106007.1 putative manganese-transporting ATPase [Phytophthora fragariae]KAE9107138.1 putative manganese-transporting ATPase [Phytophthora fragariae]KAE9141292.1 putative manganese-transporting ATPase [Phytophthora fragariae]
MGGLRVGVADADVASVALYTPLPWPMRLDLLPFLFLYVTAAHLYASRPTDDVVPWVFGALSVLCHALALLGAEWSVDVRCWMSCARLTVVAPNARVKMLAKVEPALAMLPKQLCDCQQTLDRPQSQDKPQLKGAQVPTLWFSYQNLKFCVYESVETVNKGDAQFRRLDFPCSDTLQSYLLRRGVVSNDELLRARGKWGRNDFELPVPKFAELLKEQLVAPFFVFQFFCMLLWCLDEYVYYSLLTLLMLVIFECTVAKQRQQNMDTLLPMRRPPQPCLVFRVGSWIQVSSDELVPGDICSVGHNERDTVVPCDLLLLRGNCVVNESMLSGESVPLRKEAIGASIGNDAEKLKNLEIDDGSSMKHKRHVLFGGTKVLQHTTPALKDSLRVSTPPDGGCIGFVLRTGFGTTQGSLIRTILYSSQRVTANNSEAMWFIVLLLNFAVAAAAFVLAQGINDPTRNQFKLFLHCIMIVTSVVPPELPMELSLAVTNSLIALTKSNIYCTEPFRIPFAGRVDICCFDKTGTLTSDELKLHGVAGLETHVEPDKYGGKHRGELDIIAPEQLPLDTELVLAGCQSLVLLNGQVAGDPLEMTAVRSIQWCLINNEDGQEGLPSVQPSFFSDRRGEIQAVDILHSFTFSSELKRMTTVVCVRKADNDEQDEQRVLTKGAPEVLESILSKKPTYYRRVYRHYASKGCRVLALGFRVLSVESSPDELRRKPRHELESDLRFAGFLILDCPLKDDTKRTIRELMVSKHKVTMVTGDNPLTACDVARQVGINAGYSKQPMVLTPNAETETVEWKSIDDGSPDIEEEIIPFNVDEVEKMQVQYDLCVTGDAMSMLFRQQEVKCTDNAAALEGFLAILENMCLFATVFARTSPQQKEHLIMAMHRCGKTTAMCGDGTNDVGALKQAHIGISIVNSSSTDHPPHIVDRGAGNATDQIGLRHRRQPGRRDHSVKELQQSLYGNDDSQIIRLGDASIASPFTSKSSSIRVIKKLIRQGRCTLVTTIQMYKILGVNCLITAYYLSSLFIHGVKNGDQQLTISGLSIAMFFLFLSRAKPARKLSHQRPPSGVFCVSVMVSIFGQFVIHLAFLAAALRVAQPFIEPGDPAMHPDGNFTPNVVNSIMFLMSSVMQVNTFVANYRGQPFMEGFWENKLLYRSALFNYAVLAVVIAEVFTPINAMLELVAMPNQATQLVVAALMVGDTIVTMAFEHAVQMIVFVLA